MGAEASVEVAKPFANIAKWPKTRLDEVIKNYQEGEYDFGVDLVAVKSITGYDSEEAKELLNALSKNDTGIINAVTLLIVFAVMGNSDNRDELSRLDTVFDLVDFNKMGRISFDEMTILLLCVGSALSFILEGKVSEEIQLTYEQAIMNFAKRIFEACNNRRMNAPITKEEFAQYVKENLFNQGVVYINDILRVLVTPPGVKDQDDDAVTGGSPARK